MRTLRIVPLVLLVVMLTAAHASAVYIRVNTGTVFGGSGDLELGGTGNNEINFLVPGYAVFPTASSTYLPLGGYYEFTLTGGDALTLSEHPNAAIDPQETGARSFWVTLALQYSFTSSSGPWTTLNSQTITISSPSGAEVGRIPVRLGEVNDTGASESDPWDVRFLFDGLSAQWTLSDGNLLTAEIFGPAGFTGASSNPVDWNYNGDVENLYARIAYDTPEPASFVLLGSALLGLGLLRRRRK